MKSKVVKFPLQTKQAIVHGTNELHRYERQHLAYARKLQGLGRRNVTLKRS